MVQSATWPHQAWKLWNPPSNSHKMLRKMKSFHSFIFFDEIFNEKRNLCGYIIFMFYYTLLVFFSNKLVKKISKGWKFQISKNYRYLPVHIQIESNYISNREKYAKEYNEIFKTYPAKEITFYRIITIFVTKILHLKVEKRLWFIIK